MTDSPNRRIPFTVIGGYLGAGKTTLLNRLLKDNEGRRLALLINDFGAINIDAALIESRTEQQINLTNGCICCGLSAGFDEAIDRLIARTPPPDHIVVEASGVADVHVLAQYGNAPALELDGVLVVANAETVREKARDKYVANTVQRQLRAADLIVLNKTDLVSEETLVDVERWLSGLVGEVRIIRAIRGDVPTGLLLGARSETRGASPLASDRHHEHEAYDTWQFTTDVPLTAAALETFIASLPATVIRAKGFFVLDNGETRLFQQVGKRSTLERLTSPAPCTRVVAIGLAGQLDTRALDKSAKALLPC